MSTDQLTETESLNDSMVRKCLPKMRTWVRDSYREEKADALKRLARLLETILHPPDANVVALREVVE